MAEMIWAFLGALGVLGVPTTMIVWYTQRKLIKRDEAREAAETERERRAEEREQTREKLDVMQIQSINACIALCKATAKAVQRIPDAHCNGDMTDALAALDEFEKKQAAFLTKLGIHALHDE